MQSLRAKLLYRFERCTITYVSAARTDHGRVILYCLFNSSSICLVSWGAAGKAVIMSEKIEEKFCSPPYFWLAGFRAAHQLTEGLKEAILN